MIETLYILLKKVQNKANLEKEKTEKLRVLEWRNTRRKDWKNPDSERTIFRGTNPEPMAPPCDDITKWQSLEILKEETSAINQHNQTRGIDIVKDRLLNKGLYDDLRILTLLNEVTLDQCHTIVDVFHFVEFEILKYVHMLIHHTADAHSEFQRASALNSEMYDYEIAHFLEVMAILEVPLKTEANNASKYVSIRIQQYFRH